MPIKLLIGCFLSGGHALADEPFVIKPPLQRQLESLVLPEVRLSDAEFMDALHYLQMKAQTSQQKAVPVPFVVHLPPDFKPRHELTLDLKSIPLWSALGHLCGQAGVEFSIERGSVTIRPFRTPSAAPVTVRTEIPAPAEPSPSCDEWRDSVEKVRLGTASQFEWLANRRRSPGQNEYELCRSGKM